MRTIAVATAAVLVVSGCAVSEGTDDGKIATQVDSLADYRRIRDQVDATSAMAAQVAARATGGTLGDKRGGPSSPACNQGIMNGQGFTRQQDLALDEQADIATRRVNEAWAKTSWPKGATLGEVGTDVTRLYLQDGPRLTIRLETFPDESAAVTAITSCFSAPDDDVRDQINEEKLRELPR